ncbi:hypothetical protein MBLNU457_4184t1 [Dothideomycetes sp. NU457]
MKVPEGAWDSHVHVIDEERFPFRPDYHYRPKRADLEDLLRFEKTINVPNVCIVAVSVYGTDNRSILDALERLKGKGRAVVTIDPVKTTDDELFEMHKLGARAARINLASKSQNLTKDDFADVLQRYASRLRRLRWSLQLYIRLHQVQMIADIIPSLGIPVIIDHLGHPSSSDPMSEQPGYTEFVSLLKQKYIYTKLSAVYRFAGLPDIDSVVREILRVAPTQVVWASDWPHTGGMSMLVDNDRTRHQDFRKVDDKEWVAQCLDWCDGDEGLARRIWVDNPRRLWQADDICDR